MKRFVLILVLMLLAATASAQLYIRNSPTYVGGAAPLTLSISQWDQYNVTLTAATPIVFSVPVVNGIMAFRVNVCENSVGGFVPSFSVAAPSVAAIVL